MKCFNCNANMEVVKETDISITTTVSISRLLLNVKSVELWQMPIHRKMITKR